MFLKSLFPFLACLIAPTTINAAGVGPEKDNDQVKIMIVNGTKAEKGRYNYFVRDKNGYSDLLGSCGGFLISPHIVLTAAHCNKHPDLEFPTFKKGESVVVGSFNIGEEGTDIIEIKETIIHPFYDAYLHIDKYFDLDYMLVVLERDSIFQPVIIPENDDFLKPGDQVYAIGMGKTSPGSWSNDLMEVDLNYIANDKCNEFYSGDVTNKMLCTLTPFKDTCQSDTGGPLIKRGEKAEDDVVVGITSFGVGCASGLPGVFARVSSGYKWIKKTVEANGGKLVSPKTAAPTTAAPTTAAPTPSPTTMVPTTAAPTTAAPTTMTPTTAAPTTMAPTTAAPTAAVPTTMAPTEVKDPCANLKKRNCKNECVFSKRQRQCLPKKYNFEHNCAQYEGKTPCLEVKVCKFPDGKCVHRCDGKSAQRCRKHKFCNLDKVVNPCFGCHLVTACGPRR